MNNTPSVSQPAKSSRPTTIAAIALACCAGLAAGNFYLLSKTNRLEAQLTDLRSAMTTQLADVQQDVASRETGYSQSYAELRKQLESNGARSHQALSKAASAAKRYSDELAKKLADSQKDLSTQLTEVRQAGSSTEERVAGIATDVTGVKGDVASTRSELDKAISDLRSVRGDLGVQSGLIATNAEELAALKKFGERDYVEFQLTKSKTPQRIGDVTVQLKKADTKRSRYTIELVANDKRIEKKDRTVNEPVQFYMARARTPYELVVNEVRNDRIVGYLAAPKVHDAR